MGIKFHCPSGHKLNVKAFLAGKKAVCPKCGEKVLVPHESDPAYASNTESGIEEPRTEAASSGVKSTPPTLAAVSPPPREPSPAEPVAAGEGAWYVRPPSGGQYGPAESDVMNGWITEGRVPSNSLVWRAGWPQWRIANEVFPQLAAAAPPTTIVIPAPEIRSAATPPQTPVAPVAPVVAPFATTPAEKGVPNAQPDLGALIGISTDSPTVKVSAPVARRRRNNNTVIVSGILAAFVLILFVVLGIVLWRQGAEPAAPPAAPSTKSAPVISEETGDEVPDSEPPGRN